MREPIRFQLAFRGFTTRDLHLDQQGREIWSGIAREKVEWMAVTANPDADGQFRFRLHSDTPPGQENPRAGGRPLGFAFCGVKLE